MFGQATADLPKHLKWLKRDERRGIWSQTASLMMLKLKFWHRGLPLERFSQQEFLTASSCLARMFSVQEEAGFRRQAWLPNARYSGHETRAIILV